MALLAVQMYFMDIFLSQSRPENSHLLICKLVNSLLDVLQGKKEKGLAYRRINQKLLYFIIVWQHLRKIDPLLFELATASVKQWW